MTSRVRAGVLCAVVTGTVAMLATGFVHHRWIAPLERGQAETRRELAAVRARLQAAHDEVGGIKGREQEIARIRGGLNSLHEGAPLGPAVSWFPPRLQAQLATSGITEAEVRLNAATPVPGLAGYDWSYWHVSMPPQAGLGKVSEALLAVARLEGQDRFVKIVDFSLHSGTGQLPAPTARMNVMAFVRK